MPPAKRAPLTSYWRLHRIRYNARLEKVRVGETTAVIDYF